jgi:hypothetical protein
MKACVVTVLGAALLFCVVPCLAQTPASQASTPNRSAEAPTAPAMDAEALKAKIASLIDEMDKLRKENARLRLEVASLRAAGPATAAGPAKPKLARTLDQQPPRNAKEAKAMVGDRISGPVVIIEIKPIPDMQAQHSATCWLQEATANGHIDFNHIDYLAPKSVPVDGHVCLVKCTFKLPEDSALRLSIGDVLNLAGDVDRVDVRTIDASGESEVMYYLSKVDAHYK